MLFHEYRTLMRVLFMIGFVQLLKNRVGNDMYVERGMQTYNNAPKQKEVQTSYIGKEVCFFLTVS